MKKHKKQEGFQCEHFCDDGDEKTDEICDQNLSCFVAKKWKKVIYL